MDSEIEGLQNVIPDFYVKEIVESLQKGDEFFWGGKRPDPPSPEDLAKWKVEREWREAQEAKAYQIAPWLKDELEAAESYY